MIVYFSLIAVVCFFSFFDLIRTEHITKKTIFVFLTMLLILFAGTRYETGNDWVEYTKVFNNIPPINEILNNWQELALYRMEAGYLLLNSFVKWCGGTINDVFLIACFFTIILLFSTFRRYAILPLITILLYMRYGYLQFNTMFVRQGLAVSLFFFSLKYIANKNAIKYFLINLIGFFFHSSLLVVFPIYFIVRKRFSDLTLIIAVAVAIVLSFFNAMNVLVNIMPNVVQLAVMNYMESGVWGDIQGKFNIAIIEKITIFGICLYFRKTLERKYNSFNLLFNLFVVSIIAYYSLFQMYVFQQRITVIFQLSTIFIIPYILSLFNHEKIIKYVTVVFLICTVTFFFMRFIIASKEIHIPYKSWLIH
jgi:hypothetical protein